MVSLNQRILDRSVAHATFLARLQTGEANRVANLLVEGVHGPLMERLVSRLERIKERGFDTGPRTTKRLQELVRRNNELIRLAMRDAYPKVRDRMIEVGFAEADFQQLMLRESFAATVEGAPIAIDFRRPSGGLLRSAVTARPMQGRLLREWWSDLELSTRRKVNGEIMQGLARGDGLTAITRQVRKGLNTSTRNAKAITKTAVTHVSTHARDETYRSNSDIIESIRYIATLDSRTTDICASLDGKEFRIGEGPRPPMHIGCRSTTSPKMKKASSLFPGLKDLPPRTRASIDGPVTGRETYGTWLKRQEVAEQNRVLGVGRAKLFRDGRVPIERFVGSDYRPLTLEQVLEREGLTKAALN